jgi:hypothetical protein
MDNQIPLAESACSSGNQRVGIELGSRRQNNNYRQRDRGQELASAGPKLEQPGYDYNYARNPDPPNGKDRPQGHAAPGDEREQERH